MADHLFDELDRWEVDLLDDLSYDGIRTSFQNWAGYRPNAVQGQAARDYVDSKIAQAAEMGFTLGTSRIRRGRTTVETTVLRDALGRFVSTGGANIRQRLQQGAD
jgi:hypothetical protein